MPEASPTALAVGDYFARAAYFESASASAFVRLARELESHGAPAQLVDGCHEAQVAELRHAREFGCLANQCGVTTVATFEPQHLSVRPLVAVALENIVEGFVREIYGAVIARYRARSAGKPRIRHVMQAIAKDERKHARLAFNIAKWLQSKLEPLEVVWGEKAMHHAASSLSREIDVEVHVDLSWEVGLPSRRDAVGIWTSLSQRIWQVPAESSQRVYRSLPTSPIIPPARSGQQHAA